MEIKKYPSLGIIGRFKPLHNGGHNLLKEACKRAEHVLIGIGSSNVYDSRNPFTAKESKEMIDRSLGKEFDNYTIIFIPDFFNGEKWKNYIINKFENIEYFVSGNNCVRDLLKNHFKLLSPEDLILSENKIELNATQVRLEIRNGNNWKNLVPKEVALYLENSYL